VKEDAAGKMALEVDDLGELELKNIAAKINHRSKPIGCDIAVYMRDDPRGRHPTSSPTNRRADARGDRAAQFSGVRRDSP
jgi:hypothetical protein